MQLKLSLLLFVTSQIYVVTCGPFERQYRHRRYDDDGQSDFELMERYWTQNIPLGFFVNQGSSETGDGETPSEAPVGDLTVRDKISEHKHQDEGSGGSADVKRDDIAPKPTSSLLLAHEKNKIEDNEKIATEEAGKLAAKIESNEKKKPEEIKSPEASELSKTDSNKEEHSDPGDKTKLRHSITCQGQKEWLQCDGPYELIKIKSAFWGRDNDYTCTKAGITHGLRTDKNCAQDESNTMNKVREACDNENVCEVVASGIYFDKADCGDIYKYLSLDWVCAPSESRIKETIN